MCVDSFVPEDPFGVPTAPGRPEMVDGDSDHFVMAWDPPRNDGGSPVKGYQLQARKWKESTFFEAGEVKMCIQKGEVRSNLIELGGSYSVRVRALNAAGAGACASAATQKSVSCAASGLISSDRRGGQQEGAVPG